MNSGKTGEQFMLLGLFSLAATMLMGILGGLKFIYPEQTELLPFFKSRPLHVSLALAWIFSGALGGIYYYIPRILGVKWYSELLVKLHFWIFLLDGILILICYFTGNFGGREYWAYPPVLSIPIIFSWGLLIFNFLMTMRRFERPMPVYLWMWMTGILFFMITFLEAHLWIFPFFSDNVTREITIQWQAYGSLTGSWNMLIYGTAIFLMEAISGDKDIAHNKASFLLFFLGLTNLMFGWAHHTYFVHSSPWIRYLAYAVSMTEWIVLGRIIWHWKNSLDQHNRFRHKQSFKFLMAADYWILFNLLIALLISIPAINLYTHGTHITVAHAMGSTIGINTMLLLASAFFMGEHAGHHLSDRAKRTVNRGMKITMVFLFTFLVSLMIAGIIRGWYTVESDLAFVQIMDKIKIYLICFVFSGIGLATGFYMVISPLMASFMRQSANTGGK